MPRERWSYAFPVGLFLYIILGNVLNFAGFPSSEVFWPLIGAIIGLGVLAKWYLRKARVAVVTAVGLAVGAGPVIPYAEIDRIVSEGGGFPSVVFSANSRKKLHIQGKDFAKLARTSLNRWSIKGEKITVTPCEPGQGPVIEYSRLGKYATYRLEMPAMWLFYLALILFVIGLAVPSGDELELAGYLGAGLAVLIVILEVVIAFYRKVQVSIIGDRIILKDENLREHILRFGDIAAVEKGLFQIKVTDKNGEVLHFPQGFVLLPGLIEELAGPPADRN
jgi:hypothetical protein